MNKIAIAVIVLFAVVIIAILMPSFMSGISDFRTDITSDVFSVSTAAGVTAANVTLSNTLWDNDTSSISITSNYTSDAPAVDAYLSGSKQLTVDGLIASNTHTLTVTYETGALGDYEAAETAVTFTPIMVLAAIIILPIILLVVALRR